MSDPFMSWNGRRVEIEQLHPEFKRLVGFCVHGPEICQERNIHPMFPTSDEIADVRRVISEREEALV